MSKLLYAFVVVLSWSGFAQELYPWKTVKRGNFTKKIYQQKGFDDVLVIQGPDTNNDAPILIFLKGFLPRVGYEGYNRLIYDTAKMGAIVIVPIYQPDRYYGFSDITKSARLEGNYNTQSISRSIEKSIVHILQKINSSNRKIYLYGHSMGALIAIPFMKTNIGQQVSGYILDAVPEPTFSGNQYNYEQDTVQVSVPVTFTHYELDNRFCDSTIDAYHFVNAPFKQYIEIRGNNSNHFSPMTNNPASQRKPSAYQNLVLPEVKKIHGYSPEIKDNVVDQYSTRTLIPALLFSQSDRSEFTHAKDYIYGTNRELLFNDKLLREVIESEGTTP
ncbi:MAG: hypothetical protein KDD48_01555 [Bdellovibrionales bacterium]|nr:hypothetical protein [Bdellovibrionales bacterium]